MKWFNEYNVSKFISGADINTKYTLENTIFRATVEVYTCEHGCGALLVNEQGESSWHAAYILKFYSLVSSLRPMFIHMLIPNAGLNEVAEKLEYFMSSNARVDWEKFAYSKYSPENQERFTQIVRDQLYHNIICDKNTHELYLSPTTFKFLGHFGTALIKLYENYVDCGSYAPNVFTISVEVELYKNNQRYNTAYGKTSIYRTNICEVIMGISNYLQDVTGLLMYSNGYISLNNLYDSHKKEPEYFIRRLLSEIPYMVRVSKEMIERLREERKNMFTRQYESSFDYYS